DRRQPAARVGSRGSAARGSAARGGAVGRGRSLGRAVGRPVGRGPGGGRGARHGAWRRRHRSDPLLAGGLADGIRPRPATWAGTGHRAITRRGWPGALLTLGLFRLAGGECFLEPPHHGRLDRRGCRPYELAHFLELVHDGLALDTELFREFVYPDLRHYAPSRPSPLGPFPDPGPGRACSGPASAYGDHRRVLIERSSASRPAFRQVFLLALKPAIQPDSLPQ